MLTAQTYAVVGASRSPEKYGFLVCQSLKAVGKTAYPVNPSAGDVDGDRCYSSLADVPRVPDVAVMIVPPAVTEATVTECVRLGIRQVWMQPGAESALAIADCQANGIAVVSGGPCLLVLLKTLRYQS